MEIASRQELARVLRSPDAAERHLLFESLNQAFEEAQEQGRQINQEALDEIYLCYCEDGIDRTWYAYLLLRLPNPYRIEVAKKEFVGTRNNKILLLAAAQMARLPEPERIAFLSPLVMDASNAARCRAAANLLDDCFGRLDTGVALRTALISDHELPLPALNTETLEFWLQELRGPYPSSTEKALLRLGTGALEFLLTTWRELPPPVRIWVMCAAAERNLAPLGHRLKETLRDCSDVELLVAALECSKALSLGDERLLVPLYDHPHPSVRAAAIAAGHARPDWAERFATEESEPVRLAILDQVGCQSDVGSMEFLMCCLRDPSWRVRARATEALVARAPASLEPLRAALGDVDERVKVAAAKGLYRLGREDWISADLQTASFYEIFERSM
ncbi:MAG: hypothetical protein C4522_01660 [Desulfobacteraceae bacterium]|nr:MAG: hypothetical protein C4522_01660 [Desulfobacteraceae bacterium]